MRRTKQLFALIAAGVLAGTASLYAQTELVNPTTKTWKYSADNSDQYALGFPVVDDSTWPEGLPLFGTETTVYRYPLVTPIAAQNGGGPTVCYLRTRFNWVGPTTGVVLVMTNFIDDGVIVYLNSTEIARWNVTAATHAQQAVAANPGGEPVTTVHQASLSSLTNSAANPLVAGENILSVSVHQAGTASSDIVFGMSVHSQQVIPPCTPTIAPATIAGVQCKSATFTATLAASCGVPAPTLQWYHDGAPITGANAATLTLNNLTSAEAGSYFVRASNPAGFQDSTTSTLTVANDMQGPQIVTVSAPITPDNEWVVTFDEPVLTLGGADDAFTWSIVATTPGATPLDISSATLDVNNPAVVHLITAQSRIVGTSYRYATVQDITDVCAGNITPGVPGLSGDVYLEEIIITPDSPSYIWRYDDTGNDMGTAWIAPGFDDSAWKSGPGVLDGKDTPRAVVSGFNVGTQLQRRIVGHPLYEANNVPTIYVRGHIDLTGKGAAGLSFRTVADDGYVLYVNGTEVSRLRAPAANDGFAIYAAGGTVGDGNYEPATPINIPATLLNLNGDNVFSILLKQNDATSSDITWGWEVRALVKGITVVAPTIRTQPASLSVAEGRPFTLTVSADGTSPSYQWSKDGVEITGANAAQYTVTTADATSGGVYTVRVFNTAGSVVSAGATVSVRRIIAGANYAASWKYETNSQDATLTTGTPWYAIAFNDTAWLPGNGVLAQEATAGTVARIPAIMTVLPLPAATYITTYFRSQITTPALAAGETILLSHVIDDGAVFYVDGVRAFTYNMPGVSPVLALDLATGNVPGDGEAREVTVPINLSAGVHTFAVEVHQSSATSSDVVFGLELTRGAAIPRLTITRPTPTTVQVSWTPVVGVRLFDSATVNGAYNATAGNPQGTHTVTLPGGTERYFRLGY